MTKRAHQAAVVLAVALAGALAVLDAADLPPDIAGIRPGMPVQEALAILRAHDPNGRLTFGEATVPQLGAKAVPTMINLRGADGGLDIITVVLTLPPNPQVVWGVSRQLRFQTGREMLKANLVSALRQKYGMEALESGSRLYWFFNDRGGPPPVDAATLRARNCADSTWMPDLPVDNANESRTVWESGSQMLGIHNGRAPCDDLTAVKVLLQPAYGAGRDEISTMTVLVADGALAGRAQKATQAAIANADAEKQQRQREQRDQQAAPKL